MSAPEKSVALRRVLLGVGGDGEIGNSVEAALLLASGFGASLKCIVVEREDLLAAAALPFGRITSRAGMSLPVTADHITRYFRDLARTVERTLTERCERLGVSWSVDLPQGDYLRELMVLAQEGDVLVLNPLDVTSRREPFSSLFRSLLDKASAVVIPARDVRPARKVFAVSEEAHSGRPVWLASAIAEALGSPYEVISPQGLRRSGYESAIMVVPVATASVLGGLELVRAVGAMRSTLVMVPDES
jgi:hypothetical protein